MVPPTEKVMTHDMLLVLVILIVRYYSPHSDQLRVGKVIFLCWGVKTISVCFCQCLFYWIRVAPRSNVLILSVQLLRISRVPFSVTEFAIYVYIKISYLRHTKVSVKFFRS